MDMESPENSTDEGSQETFKKRAKKTKRFTTEQIKELESIFKVETKLEPRKKVQVARDLGLQPRQVAIWFQNRRARWKSKHTEQELRALRDNYDSLLMQFDGLKKENLALQMQLQELRDLVKNLDNSGSSYKEEAFKEDTNSPNELGIDDDHYVHTDEEEIIAKYLKKEEDLSSLAASEEWGHKTFVSASMANLTWYLTPTACISSCSQNLASSSSPLLKSIRIPRFWQWQKVKIGPLDVSPMGFGTWAWGNQLLWGYQESMDLELQQTFNLAVENGINLFDTADSYGTGKLSGQSEKLLGKFIRDCQENKQSKTYIVVATKFAAYPWRLTPNQFVDACKSSIERIQLEQIGIGQLHWSTANYAPFQERALWDGLVAMYDKGLVRAVGVSNYGPKQLLKIHNYLQSHGVPLSSAQVQFSLLSMGKDQMEMKEICDSLGIRVIAYSPLGLGMLTGKYNPSNLPSGPRGLLFRQILPGLEPLLSSLQEVAKKRRKTMSQVAINWCIGKGTIPIPGIKSVKQVEENLGALGWQLSTDEMAQLEFAARKSSTKMIQNVFQTR